MKEKVTLKDISKALDISIGTVERALQDKPDINPETKKRVMEKVLEMNYKPNKFARSLSLKNKKRIAVIMPYNSYFWYRVKAGIEYAEKEISFYGIHVKYICLNRLEGDIVLSCIKELIEDKYDAIILVPSNIDGVVAGINEAVRGKSNLALLNDDIPGMFRLFYIGPDNQLIGRLMGELTGKLTGGRGKCLAVSGVQAKTREMTQECKQRIQNFKEVIESDYPGISVVLSTYEMYIENAYGTILKGIKENPDVNSVYSADGYLDEAAMAVRESGRANIVTIGHEISDEVNKFLSAGVVSAAVCQNPFLQGYFSLKYMVEYLIDKKLPDNDKTYINFNIYTKYNSYGKENYARDLRLNL